MRNNSMVTLVLAGGLAACAPAAEKSGNSVPSTTEGTMDNATESSTPEVFAETAWRVIAEDGARYTTLLDSDGIYRDLRNGDPWQQGNWTSAEGPEGKQLCFIPADENGVERCWLPGRMEGETLTATGPSGRRIELTRVEYTAPSDQEEGAAEE